MKKTKNKKTQKGKKNLVIKFEVVEIENGVSGTIKFVYTDSDIAKTPKD